MRSPNAKSALVHAQGEHARARTRRRAKRGARRDARAARLPRDGARMAAVSVRGRAGAPGGAPVVTTVDIVIPVHGNVEGLRRCVASVSRRERADAARNRRRQRRRTPIPTMALYLAELATTGGATVVDAAGAPGFRRRGEPGDRPPPRARRRRAPLGRRGRERLARPPCAHAAAADVGIDRHVHEQRRCRDVSAAALRRIPCPRARRSHRSTRCSRARTPRAIALPCRRSTDRRSTCGASACVPWARSTRIRSAATTAWRSTSACAPAAPASGISSPATCSSATKATRSFGARESAALASRADGGAGQALSVVHRAGEGNRRARARARVRAPRRPAAPRGIARSASVVFVSHPWGGGIRRYMNDLVALTEARCEVLFLEPAVGDTVKLSWPRAGESFALYFTLPGDLPMLAETMRAIGVERMHFHHVHLQPRSILELPAVLGVPYDYTLHDYHPICPQYHLVTEDGRYCGEPDAAGCAACLARRPGQWGTRHRDLARCVRAACCAARAASSRRRGRGDAHAALLSRDSRSKCGRIRKRRRRALPRIARVADPRQPVAGEGPQRRRRVRARRARPRVAAGVSHPGFHDRTDCAGAGRAAHDLRPVRRQRTAAG